MTKILSLIINQLTIDDRSGLGKSPRDRDRPWRIAAGPRMAARFVRSSACLMLDPGQVGFALVDERAHIFLVFGAGVASLEREPLEFHRGFQRAVKAGVDRAAGERERGRRAQAECGG